MSSGNIVKLNVGGSKFLTSKSTLTKFDGFFKTMLETGVPITRDESGAIFIDRPAKHFESILNYMRDGDADLQKSSEDVKEIQKEAQFFGLVGLVKMCSTEIEKREFEETARPIVKLNVGGTIFLTSKSTLTKFYGSLKTVVEVGLSKPAESDGFFGIAYKAGIQMSKDESGAIFIDRDPALFRLILNYMRDGRLTLPESSEDVKLIQKEAQYYGIEELVKMCSMEIENRETVKASKSLEKIEIEDQKSEFSGAFVKLNVGGTIFETAKSTLTKFDGFFKTMLESDIPMAKDATGAILIDRSPKHFDRILTFMRDGDIELSDSTEDVKEIRTEAQYYLLDGLIELCKIGLTNRNVIRHLAHWEEETNAVLTSRKKAVLIIGYRQENSFKVRAQVLPQFVSKYGHVVDVFTKLEENGGNNFYCCGYDKTDNARRYFLGLDPDQLEKLFKAHFSHLL